jgi:hypothetical protein
MPDINFQSIVSGRDQLPYVQVMVDDKMVQLTPEEARSFALQLMVAAESAIGDAFLMHFMGGMKPEDAEHQQSLGALLVAFRDYRSDLRSKGDPLQWGSEHVWPKADDDL